MSKNAESIDGNEAGPAGRYSDSDSDVESHNPSGNNSRRGNELANTRDGNLGSNQAVVDVVVVRK